MAELENLIAEIEKNDKEIAALDKKAAPHAAKQLEQSEAAKAARVAARKSQAEQDKYLAPAQALKEKNQQLKIRAGNLALQNQRSVN